MTSHTKELTALERRRVKTAKRCVLLIFALLIVLAVWQSVESAQRQSGVLRIIDALDLNEVSDTSSLEDAQEEGHGETDAQLGGNLTVDPLALKQEGIRFMDKNEEGDILWYESSWSNAQSRILLERALTVNGWRLVSDEQELVMCFVYESSAIAAGGSLLATIYDTEQGCSILIELM